VQLLTDFWLIVLLWVDFSYAIGCVHVCL